MRLAFVSNDCSIYIQDAVVVAFSRAWRFPLVPQTWRDVTSQGVRDPTTIWLHDTFFFSTRDTSVFMFPQKRAVKRSVSPCGTLVLILVPLSFSALFVVRYVEIYLQKAVKRRLSLSPSHTCSYVT